MNAADTTRANGAEPADGARPAAGARASGPHLAKRRPPRAGRYFAPAPPAAGPKPPPAPPPPRTARTSARSFRGATPVVVVVADNPVDAARLATRAGVPGHVAGPIRIRAIWAFPVLTIVVVVLTWMDVGVLRADNDDAVDAPSPASAAAP